MSAARRRIYWDLPEPPAVLERLNGVRRNGSGWQALCPAHEDRNPSLSVNVRDGKTLLHCHAGCSQEAVLDAAGIRPRELSANAESQEVAHYDYTDESGNLLYQVVRLDPKDFYQRRPDGKGGYTPGLNGMKRVLYHLPEVMAAKDVLVVEGEKDVETARVWGLVATTGGAAGHWRSEYSESLRRKHVTIIADADEPGRKHAEQVAQSVHGKAQSVKVIELPDAKDLHEWALKDGTGRDTLLELIQRAPEWGRRSEVLEISTTKPITTRLTCTPASEITPRALKWLWPDRIPLGKCTLFCGDPDVGKSLTVVDVVSRLTNGRDWPDAKNDVPPVTVAMSCAEDEWEDTVVPRLIAAGADLTKVLRVNPLEVDFNGKKAQRAVALNQDIEAIEKLLREKPEIRVMTFDPLASYIGNANRNIEKEIRHILDEVKELASRTGVTILVADHFNKTIVASAVHRVAGSTSVVGAPRAVWGFVNDPDNPDERMMVRIKCNISKKRTGLRYAFVDVSVSIDGKPEMQPRIVWKGEANTTADEAFARLADREDTKITKAVRWLQEYLADGPKAAIDVYTAGEAHGYDSQFLKRTVRPRAGVEKPYQEDRHWMWKLVIKT